MSMQPSHDSPAHPARSSYSELDVDRVLATLEVLGHRVKERFPSSGLCGVSQELLSVAEGAKGEIIAAREPIWAVRIGTVLLIALTLGFLVVAFANVHISEEAFYLANLVDIVQNVIQDFVWMGIGIFFLLRLEASIKRNRIFSTLHKLRSVAHVIDMHQLTKDPYRLTTDHEDTASSPERKMTPFQLHRYLDYCSELLSLTGKIAALYLRDFHDPTVVATVTEIEDLTAGLSRKIWQKIASIPDA